MVIITKIHRTLVYLNSALIGLRPHRIDKILSPANRRFQTTYLFTFGYQVTTKLKLNSSQIGFYSIDSRYQFLCYMQTCLGVRSVLKLDFEWILIK